ncbi:tyrosine-type recombinase/integrase [Lederbergia citrisecunda]|uniref:tyrosine-type recombinase/integrase n=1 Tax=Lederbergia citrisecunda TaxID=2833583 RepID=UPI003D28F24B
MNNEIQVRTLIKTLCSTGIRVGEILNLKLDDVNWESQTICIGKIPNQNLIHLSHDCFTNLKTYLNERE